MRIDRLTFGFLLLAAPAAAQETPSDWRWATDQPATVVAGAEMPDGGWRFTTMAPGWHVTMGPGGILYPADVTLDGRFAVQGEIFIFPDAATEGYGIFVGGRDLEGNRTWVALLARPDGSAGVFHKAGRDLHALVDWTTHEAVRAQAAGDTPQNVFRIEAEPARVRFLINGEEIGSFPRAQLNVDGAAGFRVGRGVNLHASNFDVTRRLAPAPAAR